MHFTLAWDTFCNRLFVTFLGTGCYDTKQRGRKKTHWGDGVYSPLYAGFPKFQFHTLDVSNNASPSGIWVTTKILLGGGVQ